MSAATVAGLSNKCCDIVAVVTQMSGYAMYIHAT